MYGPQCLHEAVKCDKIQLLDLLCEALDPESDKLKVYRRNQDTYKEYPSSRKGSFIPQAIHNVK